MLGVLLVELLFFVLVLVAIAILAPGASAASDAVFAVVTMTVGIAFSVYASRKLRTRTQK